ncbi:hypothetical protein [Cohnella cholangitidis]|uniref:Uncharacterized protein n=1 Tax=Cohnella cholangitidis TaxID=2598458 RepID=A0A7G5C264_9BACL|nr:hypothetical protein [Cohnella cholangitidis]QMV43298.1 hypothetical protein FPL14_20540 [Cohnella cholangitidis]
MQSVRKWIAVSASSLLLLSLAACGNATPTVDEVKSGLETAISDLKDWTGQQVESLDAVNDRVTASTKNIVDLFGELKFDLSFRENGIGFSNSSGVEGVVGVQGNWLVLDVAFPSSNADAAHTVNRVLTVFSGNNWAEDRLTAITNGNEPQTTQLENGWIETDGQLVKVHLEKALI